MSYIQSFNGGELSPLLNSSTDLEIYKRGCTTLRNFYVTVQGSAERRQGSKYLLEALSDDSRLIPFIFTRDTSYIIELSDINIRILDGDGGVLSTLDSPYDVSDIQDIKFTQVVDVMWLVCPDKKPYNINRTSTSPPTFEIEEVPFSYPPLLNENEDISNTVGIQPIPWEADTAYAEDSQTTYLSSFYTATTALSGSPTFVSGDWDEISRDAVDSTIGTTITLESNSDIFNIDMEDSYFRTSHQRGNETIAVEGVLPANGVTEYSEEVYIGSNIATINASVTHYIFSFAPTIALEKKEGIGGSWSEIQTISTGSATWTETGAGDTYLRVRTEGEIDATGTYSIVLPAGRRVEFKSVNDTQKYSDELDVSYSNWTVTTTNTWTGSLEIEKSTDGGGTWNVITTILDSTGLSSAAGETNNVTVSSPSKESARALIRISFDWDAGTLEANIVNTTLQSEDIFRLVDYIDDNHMTAIVLNEPLSNYATNKWSEGAFSTYRGYPTAITLFQNRMTYSGTITEPNTVYMSYTDDYRNFLLGTDDAEPIKVTPNTNEPTNWMLEKANVLYQGTRGSVVNYTAFDNKAITPSNVSARESLEFGGATIQGIKSNETVIYLERLGTKLREAFFSDEEQGLVSRDLTILSNEIASPYGFKELVLQKTPDQIIYGLREDGLMAGLTYERSQNVFGWSVFDFGGEVLSCNVRPTGEHDELWIIVKRDGGTHIERTGSRIFHDNLLDAWYVDSGVKKVLNPTISFTDTSIDIDNHLIITYVDHGLSNGDTIKFSNINDYDFLNNKVFTVGDVTTDTFTLKDLYNNYIDMSLIITPSTITITGSAIPAVNNIYNHTINDGENEYTYVGMGDIIKIHTTYLPPFPSLDIKYWVVQEYGVGALPSTIYNTTDDSTSVLPPQSGWNPSINLEYGFTYSMSGDITQVSNTWDGLDHLEGETVQVQGDGGFAGTSEVLTGSITTDAYYNQTVIGLRYLSILQPMFIESDNFPSVRLNKAVLDCTINLYRSFGGYAGIIIQKLDRNTQFDFDELNETFPTLDNSTFDQEPINIRTYSDPMGEALIPFTGSKLINYNDTYARVKSMYVIADLPLPMTVQSMFVSLEVGG